MIRGMEMAVIISNLHPFNTRVVQSKDPKPGIMLGIVTGIWFQMYVDFNLVCAGIQL